jgi:hypothetical protein
MHLALETMRVHANRSTLEEMRTCNSLAVRSPRGGRKRAADLVQLLAVSRSTVFVGCLPPPERPATAGAPRQRL